MKMISFIVVLLLCCSNPVFGQHPEWLNYSYTKNTAQALCLDSTLLYAGTTGGLVVTDITTGLQTYYNKSNSGLSGLLITAVHRDLAGVMWFGDYEFGLTRYDGMHWNTWHTGNSQLPHNSITGITTDHNNTLWVATQGGLASFDGTQWVTYTNYGSVQCVTAGSDSSIWFGAQSHGLVRLKNGQFTVYHTGNSLIPSNYILNLTDESPGKLWIATTAGLVLRHDTTFSLYTTANSGLPHDMVRCVAIDSTGRKWIGTQGGGLALFNDTAWQVFNQANSPMPCNFVFALAASYDGRVCVASCTQLGAFNGVQWIQYPTTNSGVLAGPVQAIAHSPGGVTWIGTTNGLASYDGQFWMHHTAVPNVNITAIGCDSAGRIWVGTGNGLAMNDNGVWSTYTSATSGLLTDVISSIAFGPNNKVYIGGYGGVSIYDGVNWSSWTPQNSPLPDISILSLATTADGALWIGTASAGLVSITDTSWTLHPPGVCGSPGLDIRAIMPTDSGVWVGSQGGLAYLNDNTTVIYTTATSPLLSNMVNALAYDTLGRIWAGTNAGLSVRDATGNWSAFTAFNSGIPSNYTVSLSIDSSFRVWVGTFFGGVGVYEETKAVIPFIFTTQAVTTGVTTATAGGEITHSGGAPVTSRGFVWDTIPDPTLSQNAGGVTTGSGTGPFSSNITGLSSGTLYYLRSFAVNAAGTAYGNTLVFTTQHIGIPETPSSSLIHLFPNPCSGHIWLETTTAVVSVQWLDLSGRALKHHNITGSGSIALSTSGLSPGIYLLQVQLTNGEHLLRRIVLTD